MFDTIIRFLSLLAIFASVFLASQLFMGVAWRNRQRFVAINKRLTMIREGMTRSQIAANLRKNAPATFENYPEIIAQRLRAIQRSFFMAGIGLTVWQGLMALGVLFAIFLLVLVFAVQMAGFTVGAGVTLMLAVLSFALVVVLPLVFVAMAAQRRRKRMEEQFPVALDIFIRALRSGHPIASAIELLTQEMQDPIGSEFGLVSDEVSYGAELTDALDAMADRWDLEDIRMFVVSLSVQLETGGNLAEILENLAYVIRARASLYRKVRALSSEGRMTGWILSVLPVVTFVGMFMVNPRFYLDVARDPIFMFGFPALIVVFLTGVFWIRKLVDIKV